MHSTGLNSAAVEDSAASAQGFFVSQSRRLIGLMLSAALFVAVLSLMSWNVADPSLSHATNNPVTNWVGYPGAAFADILSQFFGLAAFVALLPLVGWAAYYLKAQFVSRKLKRVLAWLGGTALCAGVFGCISPTASWPLPSGLGGVIGDVVLSLPRAILGSYPTGLPAIIIGIVLIVPAGYLLAYAAGVIGQAPEAAIDGSSVEAEAEDSDEDNSLFEVIWGGMVHQWLSLRFTLARLIKSTKSNQDLSGIGQVMERLKSQEDEFAAVDAAQRSEPDFSADVTAPQLDPADVLEQMIQPAPQEEFDEWAEKIDSAHQTVATEAAPETPAKKNVAIARQTRQDIIKPTEFELPKLEYLSEVKSLTRDPSLSDEALTENARILEGVLQDFGVKGEIIQVRPGPVVTLYELEPAPGIKSSRVIGLADDIARSMSAIAARVAVVPGRNAIGIELPNKKRETVYLREILQSNDFKQNKAKLALTLGKTINGDSVVADLAKMPHLLVAGTTGSGKSVAINTMILSLLYRMTPEECRLIMIDPKMLELSIYEGIPHLLTPVVTDPNKAVVALKWTVREMEQRYQKMSKVGVRNIDGYNQRIAQARKKGEELTRTVQTGFDRETGEAIYETETLDYEPMPYIVVIIDEMADLMMVAGKDIEGAVQRLAQMARAAGIHVVMATQRPSVDVITGTIKANFPTRISFQVTSKIDSRTILGEMGAEQLLGMGDMLYMAGGGRIQRVHGPFVSDEEVEQIVTHLKAQGVPEYLDAITEDEEEESADGSAGGGGTAGAASDDPYDQAVAVVLRDGKASTSYIQRRLGIGYNRAASLIERMEEEGVIGPANHAGKREILVPTEDEDVF